MNILSSFTVYTAALHALILILFSLHTSGFGLSWIDCISANKSFSSPKTSSRKPYTSSKQQERQKHSVETTINFSWGADLPWLVRWCVGALLVVGVAEGRPRGGCFPSLRGASGVRRCPSPGRPSSGAGSRGSATPVSRVRSARAWGPTPAPQRAPLRAGVARCGGGGSEAVWGASPIPAAQPVALFARLAQEFSWADYGILISVGFL